MKNQDGWENQGVNTAEAEGPGYPENNRSLCPKCGQSNPLAALFCNRCALPLNDEGRKKALGWSPVIRDLCFPGWGHYTMGMRITGMVIMGLFVLLFSLYVINSIEMAMKTVNMTMSRGGIPSQSSIMKAIESQKTFFSEFLSWAYLILWIGAVCNSLRIRLS